MTISHSTVESTHQAPQSNVAYSIVGVDVAKRKLDLYVLDKKQSLSISYKPDEIARVLTSLTSESQTPLLVVMEATGGLEQPLLDQLVAANIACAVLNPARVRQFARGCGFLEKSDKIDAQIIANHAHLKMPRLHVPPDKSTQQLAELCSYRERMMAMLLQEKNRLQFINCPNLRVIIEKHCEYMRKQIRKLNGEIAKLIKSNEKNSKKAEVLRSVPGVGPVSSATIIARLPEIGTINRQKIAKLVGVAPIVKESGTKRGQRKISGGRRDVRRVLYMAALTAIKRNPTIKAMYQRLCDKGKTKKSAIVACMRKLLIILNCMVRDDQPWKATLTS